jgi:dienelactone hydrolase
MTLKFSRRLLACVAAAAMLGTTSNAAAQAAASAGCADDVPQRATRGPAEYTSNSQKVRGLIYKPTGPANGAAVVLLHSSEGLTVDAHSFDPHAIQLAARGYHVLVPNYFEARARQVPWNGRDIRLWEEAGHDAVAYMGTLEGVDPTRVGIWGFSLGGFVATDGSAHPDSTARVAIGVATGEDIFEPGRTRRELPMMLIEGYSTFPVISIATMRDLAADLRRRGATVEVQMLTSRDPSMTRPVWCEVFQHTRRFLDANLLPAAAAPVAPAG